MSESLRRAILKMSEAGKELTADELLVSVDSFNSKLDSLKMSIADVREQAERFNAAMDVHDSSVFTDKVNKSDWAKGAAEVVSLKYDDDVLGNRASHWDDREEPESAWEDEIGSG